MVGKMSNTRMKLRPLDFSLLTELQSGRNVGSNLFMVVDASHQYVNERLAQIEDYGLVNRVGPNPNSGLYEITDLGRFVLENRDAYYDDDVDFDELIEDEFRS